MSQDFSPSLTLTEQTPRLAQVTGFSKQIRREDGMIYMIRYMAGSTKIKFYWTWSFLNEQKPQYIRMKALQNWVSPIFWSPQNLAYTESSSILLFSDWQLLGPALGASHTLIPIFFHKNVMKGMCLIHHWWENKIEKSLWKTVWSHVSKALKFWIFYNFTIPLPGISPGNAESLS